MRTVGIASVALLTAGAVLSGCTPTPSEPAPDRVFINGRIWTGDARMPEAQALATRGDRIVGIGVSPRIRALATGATEVIDLGGRRVVPGFNDAHWHLPTRRTADLVDAGNVQEIQRRLVEFARTLGPDDWVTGRGWGPSDFPDNRAHRRYLDAVFSNRPVLLTDRDGHQTLANSWALTLAKVTRATKDPANGRIDRGTDGEPTGLLKEGASSLVRRLIPPVNADQVYRALLAEMDKAASFGLTSLQVASGVGGSGVEYLAYQKALREGTLKVRVRLGVPFARDVTPVQLTEFVALRDGHRDGMLAYGIAKGMLDGTVDAHTAAMLEPYAGSTDTGLPMWAQPDLNRVVATYDKAGIQVELHAIGDRAIRMALDAFEQAAKDNSTTGRRHRVEHIEVPALVDLPRFKALGVIASTQAMFASPDAITLTNYAPALGPSRASHSNAFKLFDDAGAVQAFGSDYPVFTMNVMRGVHAAVTREMPDGTPAGGWYPDHRISVEAAIRHFTADAAYASFDETMKGTLAVGKLADFAVLSDDIFAIPPAKLSGVTVVLTVMGGRQTFRNPVFTAWTR
ncbi:MAG: amidohydrolase [Acidobacteria bacterium]|nr:amidohydrolase [Acidobacteriota bacterium]